MSIHPYPKLLGDYTLICLELLKGKKILNSESIWLKGNEDVWPYARDFLQCLKKSFQLSDGEGIAFVLYGPKWKRGISAQHMDWFYSMQKNEAYTADLNVLY